MIPVAAGLAFVLVAFLLLRRLRRPDGEKPMGFGDTGVYSPYSTPGRFFRNRRTL